MRCSSIRLVSQELCVVCFVKLFVHLVQWWLQKASGTSLSQFQSTADSTGLRDGLATCILAFKCIYVDGDCFLAVLLLVVMLYCLDAFADALFTFAEIFSELDILGAIPYLSREVRFLPTQTPPDSGLLESLALLPWTDTTGSSPLLSGNKR